MRGGHAVVGGGGGPNFDRTGDHTNGACVSACAVEIASRGPQGTQTSRQSIYGIRSRWRDHVEMAEEHRFCAANLVVLALHIETLYHLLSSQLVRVPRNALNALLVPLLSGVVSSTWSMCVLKSYEEVERKWHSF